MSPAGELPYAVKDAVSSAATGYSTQQTFSHGANMSKRIVTLSVLAATLAGCTSERSLLAPTATPNFSNGVSSPGTAVGAQFVVYVASFTYYRGDGSVSNNGKGTCNSHDDGTVGWYTTPGSTQGKKTNPPKEIGPNHAQCQSIIPAHTITVSFADVANYVRSSSGNNELNFSPLCTTNADLTQTCVSRYVHYQFQNDITTGTGVLYGTGVSSLDGSTSNWTVDLGQINSSTNLISDPPRYLILTAVNTDGTYPDSPATISW
jgi:hypothetical protein